MNEGKGNSAWLSRTCRDTGAGPGPLPILVFSVPFWWFTFALPLGTLLSKARRVSHQESSASRPRLHGPSGEGSLLSLYMFSLIF